MPHADRWVSEGGEKQYEERFDAEHVATQHDTEIMGGEWSRVLMCHDCGHVESITIMNAAYRRARGTLAEEKAITFN